MPSYASATAFRQALEQRLLLQSRETAASHVRLRKLVVFERLLARLLIAAPDRWVLKGALALDLRLGARARATKDMDLCRHDDEEASTTDMIAAQSVSLPDYFTFEIESVETLFADLESRTARYRARAVLAGRLFEEVLVDVSFSDPLGWPPEVVRSPGLLAFAGIEPVAVPVIPIEQQVAEKLHAYARTYHAGRPRSRVKDLVDLVLVKRLMRMEASRLRQALVGVFESRGGPGVPATVAAPPGDWSVPYRKLAQSVGLDHDMTAAFEEVAAFLNPSLGGLDRGHWDPATAQWS